MCLTSHLFLEFIAVKLLRFDAGDLGGITLHAQAELRGPHTRSAYLSAYGIGHDAAQHVTAVFVHGLAPEVGLVTLEGHHGVQVVQTAGAGYQEVHGILAVEDIREADVPVEPGHGIVRQIGQQQVLDLVLGLGVLLCHGLDHA